MNNIVHDSFPFLFCLFVATMIATAATGNNTVFVIGSSITIFLCIVVLSIYYFRINYKKRIIDYKLSKEELVLWESIEKKAVAGCIEYNKKDPKEGYMGAWMSPALTPEEIRLIDKIHEYYYPGDYIVDPIGSAQANYVWYEDIKYKVKV